MKIRNQMKILITVFKQVKCTLHKLLVVQIRLHHNYKGKIQGKLVVQTLQVKMEQTPLLIEMIKATNKSGRTTLRSST